MSVYLEGEGIQPVVIGTYDEVGLGNQIINSLGKGINLAGQTSLEELFQLAKGATCSVGNDTGPMHLISVQDCPSLVLYSDVSDPKLCAQKGLNVTILRCPNLATLKVEDVLKALSHIQST